MRPGLLPLVAMLFSASAAIAAGPDTRTAGRDHASPAVYSQARPGGLVTIFSNLGAKYPKSVYFPHDGIYVTGPNNTAFNYELWNATAFTPAADHSVTKIEVAVSHYAGTSEAVIALYADNAGVPGALIRKWRVSNLPIYGTCCALAVAKTSTPIPVSAGVKYWVAVQTDKSNSDSVLQWDANTTDQIDFLPFAQYCVSPSFCGSTNKKWVAASFTPTLGFAVLGK